MIRAAVTIRGVHAPGRPGRPLGVGTPGDSIATYLPELPFLSDWILQTIVSQQITPSEEREATAAIYALAEEIRKLPQHKHKHGMLGRRSKPVPYTVPVIHFHPDDADELFSETAEVYR